MNSPIILTLNLAEDSILLNEGVLSALDWPRQVQILINQEAKMLVLRACSVEDKQALVMPSEHVIGWEDNIPRMVYGEYLPAHQAVRFNLAEAEPLELVEE